MRCHATMFYFLSISYDNYIVRKQQEMIVSNIIRQFKNNNRVGNVIMLFANTKRSYYQILQIETNFTQRQLRKKYLIKARKFHPDHNQEPGALEEFKLVKQAYETLKDPQKKLLYDGGMAEVPEEVTPVHDHEVRQGRKYYQNKWYGYRRPEGQNIRDQYYRAKQQYFSEKPLNLTRYVISLSLLICGIFGYDWMVRVNTKKQQQNQAIKNVLQSGSSQEGMNKRQKIMLSYLERREKMHKVDL